MRRISVLLAVALVPLTAVPAAAEPVTKRPFTVIAVVDSGIDPYHFEFRRPELQAHPSTYIEGFPRSARTLNLSFDEPSWELAMKADRRKWEAIEPDTLYWIPGTNIIGAIGPFDLYDLVGLDQEDPLAPQDDDTFYDAYGHGTAVASVAAGATYGPDAPDTLIVAVRGFEHGLEWAAKQPWIDVITNSWWNVEADNYRFGAEMTRLAVERGKVVCAASMNFAHPALYSGIQGPSWIVSVGAASAATRGERYYTGYPNDVLGMAGVPAAEVGTYDGEMPYADGTSMAAPNVCGLIAKTISEARRAVGDTVAGPKRGALVRGPRAGGLLEDGKLTRLELEDAIQSTAVPASSTPDPEVGTLPALPVAHFIRGGYGIVDEDSQRDALAVVLGKKNRPERALEDAWQAATDAIRDAIWGEGP